MLEEKLRETGYTIAFVSKFCLETSPSLRESESVWGRYDPPKFQEFSEQKTARNSNSKFEFKPRSGLGGKIPAQDPGRLGSRLGCRPPWPGRLPSRPGCRPGCRNPLLGLGAFWCTWSRFLPRFVRLILYKQPLVSFTIHNSSLTLCCKDSWWTWLLLLHLNK